LVEWSQAEVGMGWFIVSIVLPLFAPLLALAGPTQTGRKMVRA